jgi:hypothetical protein
MRFHQLAFELLYRRIALGECGSVFNSRDWSSGDSGCLLEITLVEGFLKVAEGLQVCHPLLEAGCESSGLVEK